MSVSEMITRLESYGMKVSVVNNPQTLHVDGYHHPQSKGLPDWIYDCPGWGVSSCGFARVFMFKMG
jgi:hypothetical protein